MKKLDLAFIAAGSIGLYLLFRRSNAAQAAPMPAPAPRNVTDPRVPRSTTPEPANIQLLVPLQDPRIQLTNTNDPAKDRIVTTIMKAQLDSLGAPEREPQVVRATMWLASHGTPVPVFPTPADTLYYAATKINRYIDQTFYRQTV